MALLKDVTKQISTGSLHGTLMKGMVFELSTRITNYSVSPIRKTYTEVTKKTLNKLPCLHEYKMTILNASSLIMGKSVGIQT